MMRRMANAAWVLVAGTGSEPLPAGLASVARLLGETLALEGLALLTCGWPGVDRAVGEAFAEAVRAQGIDPATRFKQFTWDRRSPSVAAGKQITVSQDAAEYLSAVDAADVVVLLGGLGGTYLVYEHAKAHRIVLPLPSTEGDARRAFDALRCHFDQEVNLGVTVHELISLDRPAEEAVGIALRLIRQHLDARAIRDGDYLKADALGADDNDRAFEALIRDMVRADVLGFIGAGASIPGGYPDWCTLVDRMRCALPSQIARAMAFVSREQDLLMRAEHYRGVLAGDYDRFIRDQFSDERGQVTSLHLDLVRLPFSHVLTTNYDTLLERAHAQVHPGQIPLMTDWKNASDVEALLGAARRRGERRRYVHLHGVWNDPAGVVMTESDYQERYHRTTAGEALLSALFTAHAFLFVGVSFSDIDVMGVFRNTMARLRVEAPIHYAFVALDPRKHDPTLVRRRLRQKFKIEPIFYALTPDHTGLYGLVRRLAARTLPTSPAAV